MLANYVYLALKCFHKQIQPSPLPADELRGEFLCLDKVTGDRYNYTYNELGYTFVYSYDEAGNILSKRKYPYTTGALASPVYTYQYTYDAENGDRLICYNGEEFEYDSKGNPTRYRGTSLAWDRVRFLERFGGHTFSYNAEGIRTRKDGITYLLDGSNILKETRANGKDILYYYDGTGVCGFRYECKDYFYAKNLQGDVTDIYGADGVKYASYTYDAWGNHTIDLDKNGIGSLNPFRYRCYYYDTETVFYLTGTRYYDPEIGRFISPDTTDVITATPMALTDKNLYSYCDNNPVVRADHSGEFWNYVIGGVVGAVVGGVSAAISGGDWKAIALGAGVGAVGGLLAASGVPAGFQIVAGGLLSGGNNLATQTLVEGKSLQEVDWIDVGIDTAIGAGTSALSYGVTRNASKAADKIICKGANKVVKGQQSLLSGSRYGKGAIKKGTAIMNSGIKQMNTVRGTSSVVGSTSGGLLTSVKYFFKRLFR